VGLQASKQFQPQMHADARRYTGAASKCVGNALNLKARLAEIDQQAQAQIGRLQ
jgi:hypothetical protein